MAYQHFPTMAAFFRTLFAETGRRLRVQSQIGKLSLQHLKLEDQIIAACHCQRPSSYRGYPQYTATKYSSDLILVF